MVMVMRYSISKVTAVKSALKLLILEERGRIKDSEDRKELGSELGFGMKMRVEVGFRRRR